MSVLTYRVVLWVLKSRPASNTTTPTIVTGTTNVLPEKYGTDQVTVAQKHEKTGSYSQVHETQTSLLLQPIQWILIEIKMWLWFIIQETKDEFCMKCMEYKNTDIFSYALHLIIITNPWVQIFCMWLSEVRNLQNAISSLYCSLLQLLFASGSFFCLSSLSESTPCWAGVMWPICPFMNISVPFAACFGSLQAHPVSL